MREFLDLLNEDFSWHCILSAYRVPVMKNSQVFMDRIRTNDLLFTSADFLTNPTIDVVGVGWLFRSSNSKHGKQCEMMQLASGTVDSVNGGISCLNRSSFQFALYTQWCSLEECTLAIERNAPLTISQHTAQTVYRANWKTN